MAMADADRHPNKVKEENQFGFNVSWTRSHDFWEKLEGVVYSPGN